MVEVVLMPGLSGGRVACLRELSGRDEGFVNGISSATAAALLDRLLVALPGAAVQPGCSAELAVCDRDRLLAAIYRDTFGDRVETRAPCRTCGVPFELNFSLTVLEAGLAHAAAAVDPDGNYTLADGRRYRLPTLADEQGIAGLSADEARRQLAARCVIDGDPAADPEAVLAAIEAAAPLLDLELTTRCPECQTQQDVHFDIQSFLLTTLMHEARWLAHEVHRIAVAYGWPLAEILGLSRSQRRTYVALIETERTRRRPE